MAGRYRIGFDIGGTFTDFVLTDASSGALRLHKCLTTPDDPSRGALEGLAEIIAAEGIAFADVSELIHGTTLVTNAIIERRGAALALVTTRGFRDILEMGAEQRYDIYDLFLRFPEPLAPRRLQFEAAERIDALGRVVTALDEEALRQTARQFKGLGVEACAVSFLHSYRNSAHEKRAGEIIAEEAPGIAVSLSSAVCGELREYPRTVTAAANAYVQPLMARYIERLEQELQRLGFRGALRLMHSAGGLAWPETAKAFPIRLLESGPAGGGLATALFGARTGHKDVISFDMGGTTAKACLIEDGRCDVVAMMEAGRVHRFKKGSGLPVKAPVIDMIEIGAGGGSIAAIDEVGLLRVGPRSAGADPGPACYGRGGTRPTVTDANLLLGYYDPEFFLGGRMALDLEAAKRAIGAVARPLSLSEIEAAWGIHTIVTESMAQAARAHLVEKGKDPRKYAMVGFGGAGPAHAAAVARALGVRQVIIPPASGAASALGFLAAPLSFEFARSLPFAVKPGFDAAAVNDALRELEAEAVELLRGSGAGADAVTVERTADMRLAGQLHEISVTLPSGVIDSQSLAEIRARFEAAYSERYTAVFPGAAIEVVSFRVRASGPAPELPMALASAAASARPSLKGRRRAYFSGDWHEAAVHDRYALAPGEKIPGPAIIEEREATTVIPPGDRAAADAQGNLIIDVAPLSAPQAIVPTGMALEDAKRRIEADPVLLEIMWSRLVTVTDEMWITVCRTAFSLIVSEAQDFACELLDADGETLAHSPRAMPVFNLTLPRAVKALLGKFPAASLKPGDVLITNDPWLCAGHLFDIAIVTPVFNEGRLAGLTGCVGHVSDIGGTKDSLRAREIFEEGLQIPPMKLYDAGKPNETLFALIQENVRNPAQVLGDIHSFVAANALGAERLKAFMRDYGLEDLAALAAVVQGRAEKAMREAIRALPDGTYTSSVSNNPLGQALTYPLKLTVKGDRLALDFAGAPAQLPQGGLNCTMNYTAAHATYPLKCMLTPDVRGNAGCYRPFEVSAPENSILNCARPMAVNLRTRTGWYIAPNIFRALSEAAPSQVQAATGLPAAVTIYGYDSSGALYSDHLFMGGGQGGSAHGDGHSALLWPTSASNTSIELLEQRVPVIVEEKAYVTDSGGAGKNRGGLGQRVRLRKRDDDGLVTLASIYPEGVKVAGQGLSGGKPGGTAFGGVRDKAGALIRDCGTGELAQLTSSGEIAEVILSGGAGHGNPHERAAERVAEDFANGLVSRARSLDDYGVALREDGSIDAARSIPRPRKAAAE